MEDNCNKMPSGKANDDEGSQTTSETTSTVTEPTSAAGLGPNERDANNDTTTTSRPSSSSSPIDIRQAASGKFGVLHARLPQLVGEPVPIDKIIKTANSMSNMMIAHKIAIEDDFKLEPGMDISGPMMSLSPIIGSSPSKMSMSADGQKSDGPSLHSRVKDIVHEAYWDLFKLELGSQATELAEERKYDLTKQILIDIKQKILELLLPQHARLKQDIEDRLDSQIIDQLIKTHSINLIDYGHYILSVLSKLCAPVRDEKLKLLSETNDVVQLYRGIMELLELMRLDFANFTLNQYKPHIKAHSQDYEREKFTEILKQQKTIGIDGLEYTKIWLERATKRVDAVYGISDLVNETTTLELDEGTASNSTDRKRDQILSSDVVNKVLNAAYCELLEWTPQTQKLYPETLLFDEATFKLLQEQYKVLLLTSSILLTVFAFINRLKLPDNNDFKVLIKSHVITLLTASYDKDDPSDTIRLETVATKVCDDIRQIIQETSKDTLETFDNQHQELLKRQILDIQSSSNRVRELARRRILEFVETLFNLDVKHHQQKSPSKMPPPVKIPLGLNCLTEEITLTMAQLVKIIRYNRRVFFQHYQDIIVEQVSKLI
uniref:T-complex protein 11-like protein 1 n=1 Tax=Aceria tosichella TaxID=561515 RepID=A0A6G1S8W4_9ACAR